MEILNVKTEINENTDKKLEKVDKTKRWFFEAINIYKIQIFL